MIFLKKILFILAVILVAVSIDSAQADVTVPGDPLVRVDGSGGAPDPPPAEVVSHAIDDNTQKYLNFNELNTGFIVTPSMGATVVTGLRLYTANDAEERDPASYLLEGSNNGVPGPFTTISQGALSLPPERNNSGIPIPDPVDPLFNYQEINFSNVIPYTSYRLIFPTIKDAASANSMQIGEVEFLGEAYSPPASIPTMNEWGMIVLMMLAGVVSVYYLRRGNTA